MPDERTPETPADSGSANSSTETPAAPVTATETPATQPASGTGEKMVPTSRLREETGKRVRLERELQVLRQQQQQQQQHAAAVAAQPQEPRPGRQFTDDYRENLFRQMGGGGKTGDAAQDAKNDEDAVNAVTMLDEHADHVAKERGSVNQQDVQNMIVQAQGHSEQKQSVMYGLTGSINKWIEGGIMSREAGQEIHGRVLQKVQENPEVMNSPHNVSFLLDREFREAVERGDVKPGSTPPSPLQPSSRSGGPIEAPDNNDRTSSAIRGLRNLTPEQVQKSREMSMRNYSAATGGR